VLTTEIRGSTAWLTLDRPQKLNAMTREFWGQLVAALTAVDGDDRVHVVIFSGAGKCFSVGGDIGGFGELRDAADRRDYVEEALRALAAVEELSKPTIAAVHGNALGGGCELTLVCDVVVADATARFGMPESAVGLVPGLGVWRGLAHLNLHWMKYMVLTGESLDAEEARVAGLVNKITAAGGHLAEAERLAESMAKRAPLALTVGKRVLGRDAAAGFDHAVEAVSFLMGTNDLAEGISAFKARREPAFDGR
jgi:enoyl-CoA hydratase